MHTVNSGVVNADYAINLNFANKLYSALVSQGESCLLPLVNGEYLSASAYSRMLTNNSFDIIFNIKCLYDVGPEVSGFSIECDSYTSLIATIAGEFKKWGSVSVYPLGYSGLNAHTKTSNPDCREITLGLGYITNTTDKDKLTDDTKLQELVDRISAACYAPPIRSIQATSKNAVPDPYFEVDVSAYEHEEAITKGWEEDLDTRVPGDVSRLIRTTIDDVPVHILDVHTVDGDREPLCWQTKVKSELYSKECLAIFSYRMKTETSQLIVSVGDETKTYTYTNLAWITQSINVTPTIYEPMFKLYIPANSFIEIAAVWLMPVGTLGSLDNPLSKYTLYPPEYQPTTSIDLDAIAAYNGTISSSNSLLSRAKDIMSDATAVSNLTTALSKIDQVSISPSAFTNVARGINDVLNKLTAVASIIDINSLDTEYAVLEKSLSSVMRSDKKGALINAINTIKGVEQAKNAIEKSIEARKEEASKKAEAIRARMIAKGEGMSRP